MWMYLPVAVWVIGLLMWLVVDAAKYPKAVEAGKIMFTVGLLAWLLTWHGGAPARLQP
jgi:hypothetical protein